MPDVEEVENPWDVTAHATVVELSGLLRLPQLSSITHALPSHASPIATCRVAPFDHPRFRARRLDHPDAVVKCPTWGGVSCSDPDDRRCVRGACAGVAGVRAGR
ncbi:hypothetical protein GCM10027080_26110 [Pedococcus soli]